MTPEDEEFERIAQRQLAALKKATKAIVEDAAVRAVHKVMAEFNAKSDHRLMESPPEYPENFIDALKFDVAKRDSEARLNLDPTPISGWGRQSIGLAIPEQPAQQHDYWQEEAQRYAQNAEFWRGKYEAATASKPWVGLTRDERMDIINRFAGQDWVYAVEAIEAKLREKNGGGV